MQATARMLDTVGDEREAIVRAAVETQWEYDDEYDDSFDAMTGGGNDGIADVEGRHNHLSYIKRSLFIISSTQPEPLRSERLL